MASDSFTNGIKTNELQSVTQIGNADSFVVDTSSGTKRIPLENVCELVDSAIASGGKRTVRFVIGTSTNGWTEKDCDYLCDGEMDSVKINEAIQALPSNGGEIVILDGTYNITENIVINKNYTTISGNGKNTILKRCYNETSDQAGLICIRTRGDIVVRDICVRGNSMYTDARNNGIFLQSATRCQIYGNYIGYSRGNSIYLYSCLSGNVIADNICYDATLNGIRLYKSESCVIDRNSCNHITEAGVCIVESSRNLISGNVCLDSKIGIYMESSEQNMINGNAVFRGKGLASDYNGIQYTIYLKGDQNNNNIISGNNIAGKNYVAEGGTGNTFSENKYDETSNVSPHTHTAEDISSGLIDVYQGGTGADTISQAAKQYGIPSVREGSFPPTIVGSSVMIGEYPYLICHVDDSKGIVYCILQYCNELVKYRPITVNTIGQPAYIGSNIKKRCDTWFNNDVPEYVRNLCVSTDPYSLYRESYKCFIPSSGDAGGQFSLFKEQSKRIFNSYRPEDNLAYKCWLTSDECMVRYNGDIQVFTNSDTAIGFRPCLAISKAAFSENNLSTPRNIDGIDFSGSSDVVHYGVCENSATTLAKTVSCSGFKLVNGAVIRVRFNYGNNRENVTLNVNQTGAKSIYACCRSSNTSSPSKLVEWQQGEIVTFAYDEDTGGYVPIGKTRATSSYPGVAKISNSVTSSAEDTAATSSAVKRAYDLANSKANASHSHTAADLDLGVVSIEHGGTGAETRLQAIKHWGVNGVHIGNFPPAVVGSVVMIGEYPYIICHIDEDNEIVYCILQYCEETTAFNSDPDSPFPDIERLCHEWYTNNVSNYVRYEAEMYGYITPPQRCFIPTHEQIMDGGFSFFDSTEKRIFRPLSVKNPLHSESLSSGVDGARYGVDWWLSTAATEYDTGKNFYITDRGLDRQSNVTNILGFRPCLTLPISLFSSSLDTRLSDTIARKNGSFSGILHIMSDDGGVENEMGYIAAARQAAFPFDEGDPNEEDVIMFGGNSYFERDTFFSEQALCPNPPDNAYALANKAYVDENITNVNQKIVSATISNPGIVQLSSDMSYNTNTDGTYKKNDADEKKAATIHAAKYLEYRVRTHTHPGASKNVVGTVLLNDDIDSRVDDPIYDGNKQVFNYINAVPTVKGVRKHTNNTEIHRPIYIQDELTSPLKENAIYMIY